MDAWPLTLASLAVGYLHCVCFRALLSLTTRCRHHHWSRVFLQLVPLLAKWDTWVLTTLRRLRFVFNSPSEATPKCGLFKRKEEDNNVVGEVKGLRFMGSVLVHGGVGRQVSGLTRVLYEGGTREELIILRARFWLRG